MLKWILRIVAVVVVLAVIGLAVGWFMIDSIAKAGVERGGAYALGTDTRVESVSVSLLGGTVNLNDLRVANPEGFPDGDVIHSGRFDLAVDSGSLFSDPVVVRRFVLDGLALRIDQTTKGSNIGRILESLKRFQSADRPDEERDPPGRKVRVDRIEIRNVTARFDLLSDLHGGKPIEVAVPEIVLTDVTSDNGGGVVVAELFARILPPIIRAVVEQARGKAPGELVASLNEKVGDLSAHLPAEMSAEVGRKIGQDVEKAAGEAAGGLLDGVLGREKDSE